MICVLGVLRTELGIRIKAEMESWLKPVYNVIAVEQEPPGPLYEFPAISLALDLAIHTDEPVLYMHTKGAACPNWAQPWVRRLWMQEFGIPANAGKYLELTKTDSPVVATPITSSGGKHTWFNAFVVNPAAARLLREHIHIDKNRYFYENMPIGTDVDVKSPVAPAECPREVFERMFEVLHVDKAELSRHT